MPKPFVVVFAAAHRHLAGDDALTDTLVATVEADDKRWKSGVHRNCCGQAAARQSVVEPAPVSAQVAVEQQVQDVFTEPEQAAPVTKQQPATVSQPLLFTDERPEPYQPRGRLG